MAVKKKPAKPRKKSKATDPAEMVEMFLEGLHLFLCENPVISRKDQDEAQDLIFAAMEAESFEAGEELFEKALALDPMNIDALLTMTENIPLTDREEIESYRMIVAIAARRLGREAFKESRGHFWGVTETRPYMRARIALATSLREVGRLEEAIDEFEAMLELNPADNQGLRYALLPCYLISNRLDGARALFARFADDTDFNAVFSWGRVLEQFLSENVKGAEKALAKARKQNPHMESYIIGKTKLPEELPGPYQPGSEEEAEAFADEMYDAWRPYPTALEWLRGQR